jgi:hypothetical protein
MRYKIYGVKNAGFRKEMREALQSFEQKLGLSNLDHIVIKVKMTKEIDCYGYCCIEYFDDDDNVIELTLEIQTGQSQEDTIHTLAHEMVHVRQYVRGELSDGMDVWRGKKINAESIDYEDQPWEIEAEKISDKLYNEWKNAKTIRQ